MKYLKFFVFSCLTASIFVSCNEISRISMLPLEKAAMLNESISFNITGDVSKSLNIYWNFGDGTTANGKAVEHVFTKAGIYHVKLYLEIGGDKIEQSSAIIRVHTPESVGLPQVLLDTDARNEIDDQHYIAYALYSGIDVLAINSIHNGDENSESVNYGEIYYVYRMLKRSGISKTPLVFHGAPNKLERPESGNWSDTEPIITEASSAILAAARGASPDNPVYILPVGPCTNIASALLQAKNEGFDLRERIKVIWLGGGPESAGNSTYNGGNDPWSVYVTGHSGIDLTIMLENPTSARLLFDKKADVNRYPENEIGHYLHSIVLTWIGISKEESKSLFDLTTISTVINNYLDLGWLVEVEDMKIDNIETNYAWLPVEGKSNVHIIRDIDEEAMKEDFYNALNGNPTKLVNKR